MSKYSALAAAAEVPMNTEEFQMSKLCRTKTAQWGLGLSGGVIRSRLTLDELVDVCNRGIKCRMTTDVIDDDDGFPDDFDVSCVVPLSSMFR